jgi:hypothetical protein
MTKLDNGLDKIDTSWTHFVQILSRLVKGGQGGTGVDSAASYYGKKISTKNSPI